MPDYVHTVTIDLDDPPRVIAWQLDHFEHLVHVYGPAAFYGLAPEKAKGDAHDDPSTPTRHAGTA